MKDSGQSRQSLVTSQHAEGGTFKEFLLSFVLLYDIIFSGLHHCSVCKPPRPSFMMLVFAMSHSKTACRDHYNKT